MTTTTIITIAIIIITTTTVTVTVTVTAIYYINLLSKVFTDAFTFINLLATITTADRPKRLPRSPPSI
ncbi:hypothetical protein DL767_008654 [Monosporascus sp. MG133]|nr:hypothetical protein DL767_008654 [Monosporascus sp. MG133]